MHFKRAPVSKRKPTQQEGDIAKTIAQTVHDPELSKWNAHISSAAEAHCETNPAFFPETPDREILAALAEKMGLHEQTVGIALGRLELYAWISRGRSDRVVRDRVFRQRTISRDTPRLWELVNRLVRAYLDKYWAEHPEVKNLGPPLLTAEEALPNAAAN